MVVVFRIVAEDQVRPDLADQINEPQPRVGVAKEKLIGIAQPVEFCPNAGRRRFSLKSSIPWPSTQPHKIRDNHLE